MTVSAALAVAAIAIAVTLVTVILKRVIDTRPSPGQTVERYLRALSNGDAAAANELLDPKSIDSKYFPTGVNDTTSFTCDSALGAATERISAIEIARVAKATRADVASVFYSYSLAGERFDEAVALAWKEGNWHLVTGLWHIFQVRPVFESTGITPQVVIVRLGDATTSSSEELNRSGSFVAYPGVYPMAIEAQGWVLENPESTSQARLVASNKPFVVRPKFHAEANL